MIGRIGRQNSRHFCKSEGHPSCQSPETTGPTPDVQRLDPRCTRTGPPVYEDWTPDVRRLDPRRTRPQDPASPGEDFVGSRTSWDRGLRGNEDFVGFETSWDSRLCGIRDFIGFKTLWESRLCWIRDFVGPRTSWDLGLCKKTGYLCTPDWNLVLWCSL